MKKYRPKENKELRRLALERLRIYCPEGGKVYTLLNHESPSGMTKTYSLLIPWENIILNISHDASTVLELSLDSRSGGVKVSGGLDLVDSLAYVLHGFDKRGCLQQVSL